MIRKFFPLLFSMTLVLSSCQKHYLSVCQRQVDVSYLSSTHVNTPDPRQNHPPKGDMLIFDWRIPKDILKQDPYIALHVVYWDYSEETHQIPIHTRMGYASYKLFNEEYDKKQGILTYKAEIKTADGAIYRQWKHQLWVNLITIDDTSSPPRNAPTEFDKEEYNSDFDFSEELNKEREEQSQGDAQALYEEKEAREEEDRPPPATEETSSSVIDQPIQGSVMEMP